MPKRSANSSPESSSKKSRTESTPNRENPTSQWSHSDLQELTKRVRKLIPEDDNLSYRSRLDKIDWCQVVFNNHTEIECKKACLDQLKSVRKYRLLSEVLSDVANCIKPKTKKQDRHPEQPKQPRNSYLWFVHENRKRIEKKHPDLLQNEIAKILGEQFRQLPESERQEYESKAREAKQQYLEELQQFYQQHPEQTPKKYKPSELVKKPRTPLELFTAMEQELEENAGIDRNILQQTCKQRWIDMSDQDKVFWINWAEEELSKYEEDVKEHLKQHPDYVPERLKVIVTKKERALKARLRGKPEKPPRSAFHLFTKLMGMSPEVRQINNKEVFHYIAERWRESGEEERQEYRDKLAALWDDYHRNLEKYLEQLPPGMRDCVRMEECRKNVKTEPEITPKGRRMEKPTPPPLTAYKYFLAAYKGNCNPAQVWKQMPQDEKEVYATSLELKKENYIVLYEQYLKGLSSEELHKMRQSAGSNGYDTSTDVSSSEGEDGGLRET